MQKQMDDLQNTIRAKLEEVHQDLLSTLSDLDAEMGFKERLRYARLCLKLIKKAIGFEQSEKATEALREYWSAVKVQSSSDLLAMLNQMPNYLMITDESVSAWDIISLAELVDDALQLFTEIEDKAETPESIFTNAQLAALQSLVLTSM